MKMFVAISLLAFALPAVADPAKLSSRLDQLEVEARLARQDPAAQARIARELRRLEALNQPFFGIQARQDELLLNRLQGAVDAERVAPARRSPIRLRNRRTRLIDLGPREVTLGLEIFD